MTTHSLICVPAGSIADKASRMPVAYWEDCKAVAVFDRAADTWCFPPSEYFRIRQKYRGYAVSAVHLHTEGEIISGCCDRADQY